MNECIKHFPIKADPDIIYTVVCHYISSLFFFYDSVVFYPFTVTFIYVDCPQEKVVNKFIALCLKGKETSETMYTTY